MMSDDRIHADLKLGSEDPISERTMSRQNVYAKLYPPPSTPEDEICRCSGHKPIKLVCALSYCPLHCIDCNLEIAPESLALTANLIDSIAWWRNAHDAIDRLWLDSDEYEAWAKEQLSDITSAVNQRGLLVRADLDVIRRCYYWYFQDQSDEGYQPITNCPSCHAPLTVYSNGIFRQLICEPCSIITAGE